MNEERERDGEPLFQNPRNAAAGTMRNLDPSLVAKRKLGAFTYQLVEDPVASAFRRKETDPVASALRRKDTHSGTLEWITEMGAPVEPHWQRCESIDAAIAFCTKWADGRRSLEFDTDGVVVDAFEAPDLAPAREPAAYADALRKLS